MRRLVLVVAVVLMSLTMLNLAASPADADPLVDDSSTSTTIPTDDFNPTASSSPGLFDVSGHVKQAIDDWFTSLVTSAINPALDLLGKTLLSAPDLTDQPEVHAVWMVSLGVADTLFALLALIGGVIVMTHESMQSRYSAKEIAPRLVIAVITANVSLLVISQAIALANGLAQGFLGDGISSQQAVGGLGRAVLSATGAGGFFILLALVATVLGIVLVCISLIRAVLVVLLIVAAPVALACHALPQTDAIASLWWRALAACLSVQIAQSLVLVTAVRVFFAPDGSNVVGLSASDGLVSLLITLCLFWVMIKIPSWAERLVFSPGKGPVNATQRTMWRAAQLAVKFA